MKQAFLNNSIKLITKYNTNYNEEDINKLKYGLEGIYLTITKMVVIIGISAILGILKQTILTLILFNIIRYPAFGFHANSSITCLIFSTIIFIVLPYLMLYFEINAIIKCIIAMFCLINFILFAPADTPKRPLTNRKKRHIRKAVSIIFAIIFIITSLFIKDSTISTLILTSLLIETIMINPITYKCFNQTFNNYKTYISS